MQGHVETKRLGSLKIYEELQPRRLLYRQLGGPRALEDLVDVNRRSPDDRKLIGAIRHERTRLKRFSRPNACRQPSRQRQFRYAGARLIEQPSGAKDDSLHAGSCDRVKCRLKLVERARLERLLSQSELGR